MSATRSTVAARPEPNTQSLARKAAGGAFAGFFVDMFDVYLPVVALAPAAAYFQARDISPGTAGVLTAMIFVAALIGRPIGAGLFGHFGDKVGRRRVAILSVTGFGLTTAAIAVMPGAETIGIWAAIVLIMLRLVDGIFLGGEYTAASPLAMEYSPRRKRGLYGGLIMSGFPLAYVLISLVTLLMLKATPAGGLHSPYVQWGWRIPFAVGAALAFLFVAFYRRFVPESDVWEGSGHSKAPLVQLLQGDGLRAFGQVFLMMTGVWLTLYMASAVLPGLLKTTVSLSSTQVTTTVLIANAVLVIGYVLAGLISQRTGRRPFLVTSGVAAILAAAAYGWIVNLSAADFVLVIGLTVVVNLLVVSVWGVVMTYINERFHTGVRASGFGLGYSLAVIIPSFYAFYQQWLGTLMPAKYTALVLLGIGGVLISVGAAVGPETRDVVIRADDEEIPSGREPSRAASGSAGH